MGLGLHILCLLSKKSGWAWGWRSVVEGLHSPKFYAQNQNAKTKQQNPPMTEPDWICLGFTPRDGVWRLAPLVCWPKVSTGLVLRSRSLLDLIRAIVSLARGGPCTFSL